MQDEEEEDPLPADAEPEVRLRRSITACDPDVLDTWDFDVFFYTQEQLVAYVALMFVHLGLTTQDVRAPPSVHPTPACEPRCRLWGVTVAHHMHNGCWWAYHSVSCGSITSGW